MKNLTIPKALNSAPMQHGGFDRRLRRAIADQARTIRIPVHMVETINKLIRVSRQLLQELGREPTPEEIAEELNMMPDKVREIMKIAQEPVSLETRLGKRRTAISVILFQITMRRLPMKQQAFRF